MNKLEELQKLIANASNIVFLDGAGTSTDSGIKDFRSKDGLYSKQFKYPAEYMLSAEFFYQNPEDFYEFYKTNLNCENALPNAIHKYLKKLEDLGKLKAVVTQNIDGLHRLSGLKCVYEVHGTIKSNHCLKCHKFYDDKFVFHTNGVPHCSCGGLIKPDVVLYGESLPTEVFNEAIAHITEADLLIVAGTSLTVEPTCSLVRIFPGQHLVILNNNKTPFDKEADLVIHENLNQIFSSLLK